MLITSELKDKVLDTLVSYDEICIAFNIYDMANEFECSVEAIDAILSHFERLGLCSSIPCIGGHVELSLNVEAYDMVRLGGFVFKEKVLQQSIKKLELELEKLQSDFPERVQTIQSVITTITSSVSMFMKL